jgi:hypothetical protein
MADNRRLFKTDNDAMSTLLTAFGYPASKPTITRPKREKHHGEAATALEGQELGVPTIDLPQRQQ